MNGNKYKAGYTVREASHESTLSVSYLYVLMAKGQLPFTQVGRRRIIPGVALQHLIEGNA